VSLATTIQARALQHILGTAYHFDWQELGPGSVHEGQYRPESQGTDARQAPQDAWPRLTRFTVDLAATMHGFLGNFAARAGADKSDVMRELLRPLRDDADLATRVQPALHRVRTRCAKPEGWRRDDLGAGHLRRTRLGDPGNVENADPLSALRVPRFPDQVRDPLDQRVESSLRQSYELGERGTLEFGPVVHPPARRRWAAATFSSQSGTICSIGVPSRLPVRTASCMAWSLASYPGSE